jgi:predicted deacetylase
MLAMTVEIHDATPALWPELRELTLALSAAGVERPALLVVPCFEDPQGQRWDLRHSPRFAAWLRQRQDAGVELIQHGLTHRAPGPPPPGLRNAFMYNCFSRGQAEFAHLDRAEASARLAEGRAILSACGLHAEGFVAPAWQQSDEALCALRAAGFDFTAFLRDVLPLDRAGSIRSTSRIPAPALSFAAGQLLVDRGKRVAMRALEQLAARRPLVRVALHPEDVHHPGLLNHIVRRVVALRRHRRVVNYRRWLQSRPLEAAA